MSIKIKNLLAITVILVASIGLRYYLLQKPGFDNDIKLFLHWGGQINEEGLAGVYTKNAYSQGVDYPFLVPYATSFLVKATQGASGEQRVFLFKLTPAIFEFIFALIAGYLIYKSRVKYKWQLLTVAVVQPALALVSAGWGQVDSVMVLTVLIAFLLIEKNGYLATFFIFLALLVKPQALPAAFVFFVYLLSKRDLKNLIFQALFFIFLWLVGVLGFRYIFEASLFDPYLKSVGRYEMLSLNAFNFWWALFGQRSWDIKDIVGAPLSFRKEGFVLLGIFSIPVLTYLLYKKRKLEEAILALAYLYLAFFVFPTEIHERYLYPAVAFLSIAALTSKKVFAVYLVLSIVFLVNVFAVLQTYYPQFGFAQIDLLRGTWSRGVALVSVAACLYLAAHLIFVSFQSTSHE